MNTDEKFYKKLELYPKVKQTMSIFDSVERLKYLINLRRNGIPDDLYAVYLRFCIQMDTWDRTGNNYNFYNFKQVFRW